jgi:methyl-accepting chemotaxis protein
VQMDELTQQNAALVEEATASSQSMAGQVRELNDMLGRYDTGAAAAEQSAVPPMPATGNAPKTAQRKARPETRRAAGGEWIEV